MNRSLLQVLQSHAQLGDYVMFHPLSQHGIGLGEICHATKTVVELILFRCLDTTIIRQFVIMPIGVTSNHFAAQSGLVEVYKTYEAVSIERSRIKDIAFILSVAEVESGMFYLSGAESTFFIRYVLGKDTLIQYDRSLYFRRYFIEPLNVRLFTTLNTLSQHLQRSMYHLAESAVPSRSFKLPLFSMECFMYLAHKLESFSVGKSVVRKQCVTQYYNTLKMAVVTKENLLTYVRVASAPGIAALRKILGMCIGVGITKGRPTKKDPVIHCTIGSILTSVECSAEIPVDLVRKPEGRSFLNGIDFVYSEQNRNLHCNVRFTRIAVSSAHVATNRIGTAEVISGESCVYVGVWFHYDNTLFEVNAINGNHASCIPVDDETIDPVNLPINLVETLVQAFGK